MSSNPFDQIRFDKLQPEHLFALDPQDSQVLQYGIPVSELAWSEAQGVADNELTFAAMQGDKVLACMGIVETFAGCQGTAFGLFAPALGRAWLPITDFARDHIIMESPLKRLEAIVRCQDIPDWVTDEPCPKIRSAIMVEWAAREASPQVRWAMKVGLEPSAVLRSYGAAHEDHMLLERILP
ncbi:hypothetical protein [Aurantiacibacter zhengii]|uniref:GNAT family N-acetyltransferase n=1 Tax=Aurantiacibacter zhengii TaxID=2307003 RepID=A0A418NTY1_9SPHN|nr:hypothetical protein [Aurantiacibacter zhengii]RIV87503.1 hypothetical protein D2V07_03895 [Aurantiacibacter zhengii]